MSNCRVCTKELIVGVNWYEKGLKYSNYICNDCRKEYYQLNKEKLLHQNKEWRLRNKEKLAKSRALYSLKNKEKIRDANLQYNYGISSKYFNALLKKQYYKCAICGTNNPGGHNNRFHVDHCHTTGKVRGLLCHHCNTALGKFKDDIFILEKAIEYLRSKYA